MRKLVIHDFMTLDGVVQAPAYADEDTDGGFQHGGWHRPYLDGASMQWIIENLAGAGSFLLGRRTYESFAAHWPNASAEEQPLAQPLNALPKYVASTTLSPPLAWNNSTLLEGDFVEAVRELKRMNDGDLLMIGSTSLASTLIEHDLVDEFRLMIDPLIIGAGKRAFPEGQALRLKMTDQQRTTTGAMLVTYSSRLA